MGLTSGTKLGPYEIQSALGAGGMGEVYRARDTRLDRTVAIKILPAHLSENPELRQRFEREARSVSSLNHPNICQLFDVGSQNGTDYLVMEFLDGETLAERIRRGPLPLPELLKIGMTIAQALSVAHRAGMIHRDLKPGNIMLTKSGAKLMDFGLAKPISLGSAGSASAPLLSAARTMSGPTPASPLTTAGSIVGTIQYMSPEQIEGKEADARADIFALGAVLYEMVSGRRAFEGKSQISVASAILEKDPEAISRSKPQSPPAFDALISACLAKDREERFQSAHDVWLELKSIAANLDLPPAASKAQSPFSTRLLLPIAALLLLCAALVYFFAQRNAAPALSMRAYIPPPPGTAFRPSGFDAGPVVVSPDGKTLAFSAVDQKGVTNLWIRDLAASQATMLANTEDAGSPLWSPDGKYLAFVADQKLKRISLAGGEVQTITNDTAYSVSAWSTDGVVLFHHIRLGPVFRVAASGGDASPATRLSKDEYFHSSPSFLPDSKHFLYAVNRINAGTVLKVGTLEKPDEAGIVVGPGDHPRFASGHLLFTRAGHILVQSFDPDSFKLSGDPQTLGEARIFSVSPAGVLAYHESSSESELKVFDRNGNVTSVLGPLASYSDPRFSPDGKSIAVTVSDPKTAKADIWIYPTTGGQPIRVTFGPDDYWPVWSPDGKEIAYTASDSGKFSIRRRAVDGTIPEQVLYTSDKFASGTALDWSPDGKYLSLDLLSNDGVYAIWILPLTEKHEPFRPPAADMTIDQYDGLFSPDGRRLAYFSYESGRPEVYIVPFQGNGAKYQASTNGGWVGHFSHNKEFFYRTMGNLLMVAPIEQQEPFRLGPARPLFQMDLPNFAGPHMDVSPDGQRFVVLTVDRAKSSAITVVTNWPATLKK